MSAQAGKGRKGPIPAVAIKEAVKSLSEPPVANGHDGCNGQVVTDCCAKLNSLILEKRQSPCQDSCENDKLPKKSGQPLVKPSSSPTSPSATSCSASKPEVDSEACCGGSANCEERTRENSCRSEDDAAAGCEEPLSSAQPSASQSGGDSAESYGVTYHIYESEHNMPDIMRLIQKDLSEPYSIYTYRYFIHNWPNLCLMARVKEECVGAIVCKLDYHKKVVKRGYIAMLAVDSKFRKRAIGSTLVQKAIQAMHAQEADEVVLETEITNRPALRLYENLGFVRDKRLFRYYLNGVDALRLKLWLR